ncbi:MAG: helix-turn-helix domain-containing protein [Syntrophales bacterium]
MQLVTVREIAVFLRLKESTVCSLASDGKLPGFKLGKSWRFDMDTVERLFTGLPRRGVNRQAGDGTTIRKEVR